MNKVKGIVVAAPGSGQGKTTVTLALLSALSQRGLQVAPFKVGPDFIDPGHHTRITGRTSRNLDGWMLTREVNQDIFERGAQGAEIAVVEGVMGLYDGYDGASEAGSTAQLAKWLGLPVLLVVDARSMARSFAALVQGFMDFDPECGFCGVIANNVGSQRHLEYLDQAVADKPKIRLLGGIPRNAGVEIPGRHLGLYTAEDMVLTREMIHDLARLAENHLDLDALVSSLPQTTVPERKEATALTSEVRIGVPRDRAFCFYYQDNLDVLRLSGCEIVYFSPLGDPSLPDNLHGLYLGGGYPELYARDLAANTGMLRQIQKACDLGMPVYAECGGFMYLCRALVDQSGQSFNMAGVFPLVSRMQERFAALGYREVQMTGATPLGPPGTRARGHEFRYSRLEEQEQIAGGTQVYGATDKSGAERSCPGWLKNNCLGSYVHLHFRSNPDIGRYFFLACLEHKEQMSG